MSHRRLWVLINRLPQESWTQTALRDDPERQDLVAPEQPAEQKFGPWSQEELLLAALIDAVNAVRYAVVRTSSAQNDSYPAPDPFPRPGLSVGGPKFEKPSPEALEFLEKLRARRG